MKAGLFFATTILFSLSALFPVTLAEESCSSRETMYPRAKIAILDEASHEGRHVRYAEAWTPLRVIGSKRQGPWCWLQVTDGWLIDSALMLGPKPHDASDDQADSAISSCYGYDKVHITGPMNIRASATTDSNVVGKASTGQSYQVTRSRQGATWCWLNISKGWLAKTSRVNSTKTVLVNIPPSTAPPQTVQMSNSDIDNCCFVDRQCQSEAEWTNGYWAFQNGQCPTAAQPAASTQPADLWGPSQRTLSRPIIEGSEQFVYGINSTLDLMQRSAPEWYNFVLNAADRIVEVFTAPTPSYPHANTLNWGDGANRTIGVGAGSLSCYLGSLCRVGVASILAHEAAHIHEHYMGALVYPEYAATDPHGSPQQSARYAIASIRAGYSRSVR